MTPGRIAAIITCRDLGRLLPEALASVERQTRPAAEIVIVDDRSTDVYTQQTLARLARGGTHVVQGDGRGASAARNRGAALTSSEYLVWLDADDTLEPGYFAAAAARLDADASVHFVSCAMRAFGAADYIWSPAAPDFVESVATGAVPHASTMIRREIWEAVGGFDEQVPSFELLDFWASALEHGFRGIVLDEPLLNYRVRARSGYRRSIQPDTYRERLSQFYAKHREAVERQGIELVETKEAFLQGQREYRRTIDARAAGLEAELAQLHKEIDETTRALEAEGLSRIDWGGLRRGQPLSPQWGRDRGRPIDRHYIERFLARHRADIQGRVLEVRESAYTRRFGAAAVTTADVVDIDPTNANATIVADLRDARAIPTSTYDCIILTQTLQLVDDAAAVLGECARALKPGGVLLVTAPCIIRVDDEAGADGDFWRLTEASARRLFAGVFPVDAFDVMSFGNVLACAAFLYGISVEELDPAELDDADANFPVVVAIRAVKPRVPQAAGAATSRTGSAATPVASPSAVVLAYHRVAELTPDSHELCTPPAEFRAHMDHLRRNFCPMSLPDLVCAAASGSIPDRAVAVTLDDGYVDALTTASPILLEHRIPATFFVNSDRLSEPHERWWDILERIFLIEPGVPPVLAIDVAGQPLRLPTSTRAERLEALDQVNRAAWTLDACARLDMAAAVAAWSGTGAETRPAHRVLTDSEVRELADRPGHTIGAHTIHHLALTTQPVDTKRREIVGNKGTLEALLRRPVDLFAYPYGDFDREVTSVVRDAGFRAGFTIQTGLVSAATNRLLLPRCEVSRQHRGLGEWLRGIFEGRR